MARKSKEEKELERKEAEELKKANKAIDDLVRRAKEKGAFISDSKQTNHD